MIIIENEQDKVSIHDNINIIIKKVIDLCMKAEKLHKDYEVSVLIVDDEEIRLINKEHRNIDKSTDVLSFPMAEFLNGELISDAGDYDIEFDVLMLGDIIISAETAKRQAMEYEHSFEREMAFLTAHSCFHLLGYDHMEEAEEKVMLVKQEAVLEEIGLTRQT
ncbi:putative rRNA maturation factor [Ruminiclostridium sufflavum DSM 19573]|uniref:Endoribonuclease YbeY n=1 Tax=Ruminiclostridium sufflavum DSM 19573 TaxID=1121337 RepID=A0A318XMA1_9FIRM|nr:rRNA maturation RNase YbeY [Ruminiclostridium sufflavum]PYG88557.1 putative rRNA maturation factor [Ruminiclostridium sufflavum DSM 19573]